MTDLKLTAIDEIQGDQLGSPYAEQRVRTRGVVTAVARKGFFIQDPQRHGDPAVSSGIFVFGRRDRPRPGTAVEVEGQVVDYAPTEDERPTTQILLRGLQILSDQGEKIEPVWLTSESLPSGRDELVRYLNGLEGMLVGIKPGATFIAPSNPFGDYVVLPQGTEDVVRTRHGGVRIHPDNPQRWFPGFRIRDWQQAPAVNVGAKLLSTVVGPLNFRSSSYQMVATGTVEVSDQPVQVEKTGLKSDANHTTILTLNGFNLDSVVENRENVSDPDRDVDDDVGNQRFKKLALAVVEQAASPDILALQEIQDNDGAEQTGVVDATETYAHLIRAIQEVGGPTYEAADVAPVAGADGGQPGGNIRNGFLFDPGRVELVAGTLGLHGEDDPAFEDSRKVLVARFRKKSNGDEIAVANVHLASKRQQHGLFSPVMPGHDPRLPIRVRQAEVIREYLLDLRQKDVKYYVTGDFNDFEFSQTLQALLGSESVNLVDRIPEEERYDYNHRGHSQVLMHGVVSREEEMSGRVGYEILHGNELIGTKPGDLGDKPTDHGYVVASFEQSSYKK